jgi:hypothetical protein
MESIDYLPVAFAAVFTDFLENFSESLVVGVDKVSEQLDFRVLYVGTNLNASYEFETIAMDKTRLDILRDSVVIRDSDRIEIMLLSLLDTVGDRTGTV